MIQKNLKLTLITTLFPQQADVLHMLPQLIIGKISIKILTKKFKKIKLGFNKFDNG